MQASQKFINVAFVYTLVFGALHQDVDAVGGPFIFCLNGRRSPSNLLPLWSGFAAARTMGLRVVQRSNLPAGLR